MEQPPPIDFDGDSIIFGWTMRQWITLFGRIEVVKMFLNGSEDGHQEKGDATKKSGDRRTPLHWAASKGYNDIVRLLQGEFSMDVNAKNLSGLTPLHLAAENGDVEVVKQLLCLGADVYSNDNHNRMPIHLADANGHFEVARILLNSK